MQTLKYLTHKKDSVESVLQNVLDSRGAMIVYMRIPHFVKNGRDEMESSNAGFFSGKLLAELLNAMKNHKPAQRDPTKPINLRPVDSVFRQHATGGLARTDPRIAPIHWWKPLVIKRWKLSKSKRSMGPSLVLSSTSTMAEWNRGSRTLPYNNLSSSTEEEEDARDESIRLPTGEENSNPFSQYEDTSSLFVPSSFHAQLDPTSRHPVPFPSTNIVYDPSSGTPVVSTYIGQEYGMSPLYASATRPSDERNENRNAATSASLDHGNRNDDDRKPSPVLLPRDDAPRNLSPLPAGDTQLSPHGRHSISANPFRSMTRSPSHRRGEASPTQDRFINPMFSFGEDYETEHYDLQHALHTDFTPIPTFDQAPIAYRLGDDHLRLTSGAVALTGHAPSLVADMTHPRVADSIHSVAPIPNPQHELRRRVASPSELEAAETERARSAIVTWYERFNELIDYCEIYSDCNVPQKYPANPKLGIWVNKQRMEKKFMDEDKRTSMTARKVQALESIGFTWAKRKGDASWMCKYNELQSFAEQFGTCDVPTKYAPNPALGRWVSTQRSEYKVFMQSGGRSRHLTQGKIDMLNSLGFKWEMIPTRLSNSSTEGSSSPTNRGVRRGSD